MTIEELINDPIYNLPLTRTKEDFPTYVNTFLYKYIALVRKIEGDFSNELKNRDSIIYNLIHYLIKSIESYYIGHVPESYNFFKEAVESVRKYLVIDDPSTTIYMDEKNEQILKEDFFKARISYGKSLEKHEMFIRPFEQRENIPTYRYSIPGLPCLYLSNNILTAWHELGCPDINSLQVSRFELDKSIKKLSFGLNKSFLKYLIQDTKSNSNDNTSNLLVNYITYFPLQALCTIKVQNTSGIFKPEYVFPQFLMQWITEQKIHAVEYMSTKIDYRQFDNTKTIIRFNNLAIPALTTNQNGYCIGLQEKIKLTDSISWQNLQSTYPLLSIPKSNKNIPTSAFRMFKGILDIELIKGQKVSYNKTIFGIIEKYLIENMTTDYIKN